MPKKTLISNFNAVKTHNILTYDKKTIAKIFNDLFSNLAEFFLIKLSNATHKYFHLSHTPEEEVFQNNAKIGILKAASIDNLSGKFLKDGAKFLAKPISKIEIFQLPIELFQMLLKLQSPNLFLRKAKNLTHLTTDPFFCYH